MTENTTTRPISFVLHHNYNVKVKRITDRDELNHFVYQLTIKGCENVFEMHIIQLNGIKNIVIKHNPDMTITECEKLTMFGNLLVKNGYGFECDKIVDKKQTKTIQQVKKSIIDEMGEKIEKNRVKKSRKEVLLGMKEKLLMKVSKIDEELNGCDD